MKKVLFLLLFFSLTSTLVQAQQKFSPSIKASFEAGIDDNKNKGFGIEFIAGYKLNDYFSVGVGTGISYCDLLFERGEYNSLINKYIDKYRESEAYVPLFANAKAKFMKEGIAPYISLNIGYSFLIPFSDYAKKAELGLMALPTFGVEFPVSKGSIFTELGYKYQAMSFNGYGRDEKLNYSQITLSVGYNF